jgi:Sulfotransferase family
LTLVSLPERDPERFQPVFVLAPARSHTSVISTMVGRHPNLVDLPELKLFCYSTIRELEESLPGFLIERGVTHRSPGLVRALAQFMFGGQTLNSLALARAWLRDRGHWSGADVLDVLIKCNHPRCCVEKSPEDVESDATLQRLAAAYPRARYLHLTRHPVTTQQSMAKHLNKGLRGRHSDAHPAALVGAWFVTHKRILRFAAGLPASRYLRVRSEDVLNDRPSNLRKIASWLDLRADDSAVSAMSNPAASPFACFGPEGSGIVGGNDHDFLRDPAPHAVDLPATLDPPSGWSEEPGVWKMVAELSAALGYP